jgi:hypothetical protein
MAAKTPALPSYAPPLLWLSCDHIQQAYSHPDSFPYPPGDSPLFLRWGHPGGSPLAVWPERPAKPIWDNRALINGHIDTLHLLSFKGEDLALIEVRGSPLSLQTPRFPSLADLQNSDFERDFDGLLEEKLYWYAFIIPLDSPLLDFAQQAFVNGNAVDFYAGLAPHTSHYQSLVGLPLILDSLTMHRSLYG